MVDKIDKIAVKTATKAKTVVKTEKTKEEKKQERAEKLLTPIKNNKDLAVKASKPKPARGLQYADLLTPKAKEHLGITPAKPHGNRGRLYDRQAVTDHVCEELLKCRSLWDVIYQDDGMPDLGTFMDWMEEEKDTLGAQFTRAREKSFMIMAEDIVNISNETTAETWVAQTDQEGNVLRDEKGEVKLRKMIIPMNSDVVAHKRLQIETRKWVLSKVLPKIYGDKVTTQLVGSNDGPIQVAAVDMKGLSDDELEQMKRLLTKTQPPLLKG